MSSTFSQPASKKKIILFNIYYYNNVIAPFYAMES